MNIPLLRAVSAHILEEPRRFDMGSWATDSYKAPCGTAACIGGWGLILSDPDHKHGELMAKRLAHLTWEEVVDKLANVYDITPVQAEHLFYFTSWPEPFRTDFRNEEHEDNDYDTLAAIAVARIEHFIQTNGAE